jgi:protein TonB
VEVAFLTAPTLEPAGGESAETTAAEPAQVAAPAAEPEVKQEPDPAPTPRKPRAIKPEKIEPALEPKAEAQPVQPAPAAASSAASGSSPTPAPGALGSGSATVSAALAGQKAGTGRGAQAGSALGSATTTHRYEILPFGPGMTRPQPLSGRDPVYTRAARMARVEGTVIARCVITVQGRLEKCRIVKGQPHMDDAVLQALATRRYTPVMYQGHVQAVLYNVHVTLRMRE